MAKVVYTQLVISVPVHAVQVFALRNTPLALHEKQVWAAFNEQAEYNVQSVIKLVAATEEVTVQAEQYAVPENLYLLASGQLSKVIAAHF